MGTAGGEPARRRLGRATAAQRLGFRQYSREDSERAQRARFESSRDHRARTDRSPVIGLSSTACRTLPEEQLLRPIAGERSLLVRWLVAAPTTSHPTKARGMGRVLGTRGTRLLGGAQDFLEIQESNNEVAEVASSPNFWIPQ